MASSAVQGASQIPSASNAPGEPVGIDRVATATAVELPDGRRLSVECWPGDGAPLVLLHGLLDCAVGWKHVARMIDRPCYAFDLPGFGDSDCPKRNRVSAYAEDVQAALAAPDVHDFTLVGHPLGGEPVTGREGEGDRAELLGPRSRGAFLSFDASRESFLGSCVRSS
jgi:hypothetical protein